jgi:hypothetical protein
MIGTILPFAIIFLPLSFICIFSFSVLYYGTPEFRVDKTQYGLKIGKIHQTLNPVQSGDIIVRINSLTYEQILVYLVSLKPGTAKPGTITVKRGESYFEFEPKLNPVSPFRFLSIAWPHLLLMFSLIFLGFFYLFHFLPQPYQPHSPHILEFSTLLSSP